MTVIAIIAVYLALLLVLGAVASRYFRGSSEDYMVASHTIGPFLLLMSLFGTTMTAFALVGSSGEAYTEGIGVYGMLASSSGIIHSLCFLLIGVKLWSFGKRYGYTTQVQFFRDRLESDRIGLLLFPILAGLVVPYLLIGVIGAGTVVSNVTEGAFRSAFAEYDYGVPPWLASGIICVVVLMYVFFGGMRGTAWANAFQTLVFMALGVVTFAIISSKLGGVQTASRAVIEKHPSKFMRAVDPTEHTTYEKDLEIWKQLARYNWLVDQGRIQLTDDQRKEALANLPPGPPFLRPFVERRAEATWCLQQDLMPDLSPAEELTAELTQDDRVLPDPRPPDFAAKTLHDFPKLPAPVVDQRAESMLAHLIGHPKEQGKISLKRARGAYRSMRWAPEEPKGVDPLAFLTYMFIPLSVGMFPHLFQHWLTAKSASSFKLPVVAHPVFIAVVWLPCVLIGVWATSVPNPANPKALLVPAHFNPNGVLAYMVGQLTNDVLTGLLTAGVLAAIMSSLDSQFLCLGTMFTEDIVVHYGGKGRFTDRQIVFLARLFIVGIVVVTYILSQQNVRKVFTLGVWTFSGFSSLFPLVFAAVYWRRLTKAGAYACVLAAITAWLILFRQSNYAEDDSYTFLGMNPVAAMIAASTLAMIGVSLLTRPPSEATLEKYFGPAG